MQRYLTRLARQSAILATLLTVTVYSVSLQAASFRKTWDPKFSVAFTSLVGVDVGWRGFADITVADGCVGPGVVGFPNVCGLATLDSYTLSFYDVGTTLDLFPPTSGSAPGLPDVAQVSFDGASIADGVDLLGPIVVPGVFAFGNYQNSFKAYLGFALTGPTLELEEICNGDECPSYTSDITNFPPQVTWRAVPVPASLPLVAIGLAALGLTRRARKA